LISGVPDATVTLCGASGIVILGLPDLDALKTEPGRNHIGKKLPRIDLRADRGGA